MLDVEKVRLMTELARYENAEGKEDLRISRYYRSDYIGISLLKNLLAVSLGYLLLWGIIVAYNLDFLLDNVHKMDFSFIIFEFVIGYAVIVLIYSIITYTLGFSRYAKAKKRVNGYDTALEHLASVYGEDE